jgi:hypothetical protein
MKKIFIAFMALIPLLSAFGQGIITPERIHIGDTSSFPAYSDGPVKIFSANNLSYGLLLLKNPISNLCTAADFYNDRNLRLTIGIAGSENSNFYRNCGYIFMSDQNSDNPAEGLVIGHRYASAPIIFAQNNKEVLRISAEGNLGIGTSTPEVPLRIEADVPDGNGRALIRLRNTSYAPTASVSYGLESNDRTTGSTFTHTSSSFTAIPDFDNFSVIAANGRGFAVYTTKPNSSIRFHTNMDENGIIERMRITGEGNIGIGTKIPLYTLDVSGFINTSKGIRFPDGTIQTSASDSGHNSSTLLTERIHIGDTTLFPAYADGPIKIITTNNLSYGALLLKNPISNLCTALDCYNDKNLRVTVGIAGSENSHFYRNCGYIFTSGQNSDEPIGGLVIGHLYAPAPIIFAQGNNEVIRISSEGNLGIGTDSPKAKVEVADGDIFISDINKGIIMKSPDGQCWRGTLDNFGILNFVVVNCDDFTSGSFIDKSAALPELSIYPNPVQKTVTITSQLVNLRNTTAILITLDGKIVKKEKLLSDYSVLKMDDIPQGNYVIKIVNKKGEEIGAEKIIKN